MKNWKREASMLDRIVYKIDKGIDGNLLLIDNRNYFLMP